MTQVTNLFRMTLVSVALILFTVACTPTSAAPEAATAVDLSGTGWTLTQYGPVENPVDLVPGTTITLEFTQDDLGGTAGCNHYGGGYQISGQTITIEELFRTLMACLDEGVMDQEEAYMLALTAAETFTVENETLTILYNGGALRYTRMQPPANLSLEEGPWQLTAFGMGDVVGSLINGTEITAVFADGSLSGSAGCNQYMVTYTIQDNSIKFGEIGSTKMWCENEETMTQESAFLDALRTAETFTIEGNQLRVVHDVGTLYFNQLFMRP